MAKPTTRDQLQDHCLRALGAPVIEINVDEDQIEDRTDDAIQFYQEFHSDAVIRTYLKHQLTADDITNNYIKCLHICFLDLSYLTKRILYLPQRKMFPRQNQITIPKHHKSPMKLLVVRW